MQLGYSQSEVTEASHIKTIVFKPTSTNSYVPIVKLGEKLRLTFDDLNADEHDYTYKIEHCTIDWDTSNLSESNILMDMLKIESEIMKIPLTPYSFTQIIHYHSPMKILKLKSQGIINYPF